MLGLLRFAIYGPVLGAMVGVVIAMAEYYSWNSNGRPDGYIRGSGGLEMAVILWTVAGAIVGIPFGAVVAAFEYGTGRAVRIGLSFSLVLLTAFAACWIYYADTSVGRMLSSLQIGPPTLTVLAALIELITTSASPVAVRT